MFSSDIRVKGKYMRGIITKGSNSVSFNMDRGTLVNNCGKYVFKDGLTQSELSLEEVLEYASELVQIGEKMKDLLSS